MYIKLQTNISKFLSKYSSMLAQSAPRPIVAEASRLEKLTALTRDLS